MTYLSPVFTITTTRRMAHKCNYRLFTEKCIIKKLSFNSSINTSASFSTTGMITFMNLDMRLRLRATRLDAGKFLRPIHCFLRLVRNLLVKMEHFDWLNTVQGINCLFVTVLSST